MGARRKQRQKRREKELRVPALWALDENEGDSAAKKSSGAANG